MSGRTLAGQHGEALGRSLRAYWDGAPYKIRAVGVAPGSDAHLAAIAEHHRVSNACSDVFLRQIGPGQRILDLYHGLGVDALDAAEKGATAVYAAACLSQARMTRRAADARGASVAIVVVDLHRLPFRNDTFDFALARGSLMYAFNPQAAVDEIARTLAPGGTVVAHLLNRHSWFAVLARLSGTPLVQESGEPPYLRLDTGRFASDLFAAYAERAVTWGRFPRRTEERSGLFARLFNHVLVPIYTALPRALVRRTGYYIVVRARKGRRAEWHERHG